MMKWFIFIVNVKNIMMNLFFAFRNWGKVSSILGMFSDTMDIKN